MLPIKVLNLGCGRSPLKSTDAVEYTNLDMVKHPLIQKWNIMKFPYPLARASFDKCYFFHCIEHIPENYHKAVLTEVWNVLKPNGRLFISYPEFKKIAMNYIQNTGGQRDFWKATIYGRGTTEWDRHKALMDTTYFEITLREVGFKLISAKPEKTEIYNTVVIVDKVEPLVTYEQMLGTEYALDPNASSS